MTVQRIASVIPNLSGGGAARVAAILCGEWCKTGHEVHLITYEHPGAASVYPLHGGIVRHQLGLNVSPKNVFGYASNNARRIWRLRRALKTIAPTAIVAFLSQASITSVLAARGLGAPVLISERNHPAYHIETRLAAFLRRHLYRHATQVCVQTDDIRNWFRDNLALEASVIPNPVLMDDMPEHAPTCCQREGLRRKVVALGRLAHQKGFDVLIDAFAKIAPDVPLWDLIIHGEGDQRSALRQQVDKLGLADRIFFPGSTLDPLNALRAADLYVHPARYEGFPNAVLEALTAGLCVVATDAPGGTGEILQGGKHGLLVPPDDAEALAAAMLQVMKDEPTRSRFAATAQQAVRIYEPGAIASRWLDEIEKHQQSVLCAAPPAKLVRS